MKRRNPFFKKRRKNKKPDLKKEQEILNTLITQNPHIKTLMDEFDLELIKTPEQ